MLKRTEVFQFEGFTYQDVIKKSSDPYQVLNRAKYIYL